MNVKYKLFKAFQSVTKPFQALLSKPSKLTSSFIEGINIVKPINTQSGKLLIAADSVMTYFRAETFFSKEPDTLAWINTFKKGDVFYDIGANVGLYSLYAALRGISTICFEPESQNYAELNRNIFLNKLDQKIRSFNLALSNEVKADYLYLSNFSKGAALHNFGEARDFNKNEFIPAIRQAVCSFTLDKFIENFELPSPTHIKIDVDGLEKNVFEGADSVIQSSKTRSILIELNTQLKEDQSIIEALNNYGYRIVSQYQMPNPSEKFRHIYNFIFSRDEMSLDL